MIYEACTYTMNKPTDAATMVELVGACVPYFDTYGLEFLGAWTSGKMLGGDMCQVHYMLRFASYAELEEKWALVRGDQGWVDAELEITGGDFSFIRTAVHRTMGDLPFSPDVASKLGARATPALYEWREYDAPHSGAMGTQAAIAELSLPYFQKHGCEVVGLWTTSQHIGPDSNKLIYLLRFDNLAHLESAWAQLRGDTEWQARFAETCGDDYSFIRRMANQTLRPVSYSRLA